MMTLWLALRFWLIRLLAGDYAVLVNLRFHRCELNLSGRTALMYNVVIEVDGGEVGIGS